LRDEAFLFEGALQVRAVDVNSRFRNLGLDRRFTASSEQDHGLMRGAIRFVTGKFVRRQGIVWTEIEQLSCPGLHPGKLYAIGPSLAEKVHS